MDNAKDNRVVSGVSNVQKQPQARLRLILLLSAVWWFSLAAIDDLRKTTDKYTEQNGNNANQQSRKVDPARWMPLSDANRIVHVVEYPGIVYRRFLLFASIGQWR